MCSRRQAECSRCVLFGFPGESEHSHSSQLEPPCVVFPCVGTCLLADRPASWERAPINLARTLDMSALRKGPQEV